MLDLNVGAPKSVESSQLGRLLALFVVFIKYDGYSNNIIFTATRTDLQFRYLLNRSTQNNQVQRSTSLHSCWVHVGGVAQVLLGDIPRMA